MRKLPSGWAPLSGLLVCSVNMSSEIWSARRWAYRSNSGSLLRIDSNSPLPERTVVGGFVVGAAVVGALVVGGRVVGGCVVCEVVVGGLVV